MFIDILNGSFDFQWFSKDIYLLSLICLRKLLFLDDIPGLALLTDAGVALLAALMFFIIPSSDSNRDLLTWEHANKLPWGLLILFGGGLSLAAQIGSSGLGLWIGQALTVLETVPPIVLILCVATMIIFLLYSSY